MGMGEGDIVGLFCFHSVNTYCFIRQTGFAIPQRTVMYKNKLCKFVKFTF